MGLCEASRTFDRKIALAELRKVLHIAWPTALSLLGRFAMGLTDLAFVGHLSTVDLAAVATALVWQNVTIQFVNQGISGSVKTLVSQARGARNRELMSAWLAIGLAFGLVGGVVMMGLWALTPFVVPVLNNDPEVVRRATLYNLIVLPICVPEHWFTTTTSFLQSQGRVILPVVINTAFVGVNVVLNYVLIFGVGSWAGLGFAGAAVATLSSRMLMYVVFFVVVFRRRYYDPGTWRGIKRWMYTKERIKNFAQQFVPLGVGRLFEELQLQLVITLAAQLGKAQVSAHSAFLQLFFVVATAMYGAVEGVVVRLAHRLGEADEAGAKTVMNLGYILCSVIGVVWFSVFILSRNVIGSIFSDDESVRLLMSSVAPIVGVGFILLSFFYAAVAALRGMGRVTALAVAFLVGGWGVAVPLSFVDVFALNLSCAATEMFVPNATDAVVFDGCGKHFVGLWWCLSGGYFVVTLVANAAVARTKFQSVIEAAKKRSEIKSFASDESGLEEDTSLRRSLEDGDGGGASSMVRLSSSEAADTVIQSSLDGPDDGIEMVRLLPDQSETSKGP